MDMTWDAQHIHHRHDTAISRAIAIRENQLVAALHRQQLQDIQSCRQQCLLLLVWSHKTSYLLDTNMLQNLIANLLHDLGSRIVCLVDTVAKAHQPTHTHNDNPLPGLQTASSFTWHTS